MLIQRVAAERYRRCISGAPCRMGSGLLPVRVVMTRQMRVTAARPQSVALVEGCKSVRVIYDAPILTTGSQCLESRSLHLEHRRYSRQLVPDTAVCCEQESGDLRTASLH